MKITVSCCPNNNTAEVSGMTTLWYKQLERHTALKTVGTKISSSTKINDGWIKTTSNTVSQPSVQNRHQSLKVSMFKSRIYCHSFHIYNTQYTVQQCTQYNKNR